MSPKNHSHSIPEGETLGTFKQYREAVNFVQNLIENDFPATSVSIVGSDLSTVESIRGRLGYGRVALSGMMTGAWVGLFFGLIFGATGETEAAVLSNVGAGVVIGAGIGMLFNVIRFSLTKNRRNFISGQLVVAKKYQVIVPKDLLAEAKKAMEPKAKS